MSDLKELKKRVEAGEVPASTLFALRLNRCNVCPKLFKPTRTCKVCLCFVDLKTKMISQSCPDNKW